MDVAELLARRDLLDAAQAPQQGWLPSIFESRGASEGYAIYPKAFGRWGVGYTERASFNERETFHSEGDACQYLWQAIVEYTVRDGLVLYRYTIRPENQAFAVLHSQGADLERFASSGDYVTRAVIATRTDVPATVLAALASDVQPEVVWRVAANPTTPVGVLSDLARDSAMHGPLALNPSLPGELVDAFTRSTEPAVTWRIARNPAVPAARLVELCSDPDFGVRWGVAANPSTPAAVLASLAHDTEAGVRLALALNPSLTPETLAALAADSFDDVRREIARHPRAPQATLALLATDADVSVALWVGRNPASGVAALTVLARHPDAWVREHAADNWNTPVDVLRTLARDKSEGVRTSAAVRLAGPK